MLDTNLVTGRRSAYACCAAEASEMALNAIVVGDKECYKKYMRTAAWYRWGADVMSRTPISADEDCCGSTAHCVTDTFALATIRKIDALDGCVKCGCGSPEDRPITCVIEQDITVYQALDALDELVGPNVAGRTTLIVSNNTGVTNNWSAQLGDIATDDGAGNFTYTTPPPGTVIMSSASGLYYVAYPGGAGPYFPIIDGDQNFSVLTLVSRTPYISLLYGRNVIVEVSDDNVNWVVVYSGPETPLANGYDVTLSPGFSPTAARTKYFYEEFDTCSYEYAIGTIPPFVFPPCGILEYSITPESACNTENWTIDVEFTQVDGWTVGTVTPVVNGVAQPLDEEGIVLGTLTFGPYIMGDLVTFSIVNNLDAACDITTPVYADPRVGVQDFTVLRAVDANEYAALNGDGNDYFIVSNVDNLAADWGLYLNKIWLGASSTYQLVANLDIVYASNPGGALGFWQLDGILAKQLFPQPTYTFNTVTEITVVTLPPVAPFTQAWGTLFMQALWTPVAGSPYTIYNGAPGSFATVPFSIPNTTTWPAVMGIAAYSDGCAVRVPALLDTYTPNVPALLAPVGVNAGVNSLGVGPNGSFYIGGFFTAYDEPVTNVAANSFTRLLPDLTLDAAFNANVTNVLAASPGFDAGLRDLAVDSLGRIVCVGGFSSLNDFTTPGIARINPDGTRDATFVVGTGFNSVVNGVSIDSMDRVICTGAFVTYNGVFVGHITRLTTTGAIDTTFNYNNSLPVPAPYAAFNNNGGNTYRNIIDSDGTILVNSGQPTFDRYTGQSGTAIVLPNWLATRKAIVRLNTDGALIGMVTQGDVLDGPTPPIQNGFAVQPDGKIICAGSFVTYDGTTVNRIVRMDQFGTLDAGFLANTGTGFDSLNAQATSADIMPNGQIMVGCAAGTTFNGSSPATTGGLIRLDATGARDLAFNIGAGFSGDGSIVVDVLVTTLGDIIVGGSFTMLDGNPSLYVAKF